MIPLHNLHETNVSAFWKTFMAFHHRPQRFNRRRLNIVDLNHAVWVPHGDHAAQYCLFGRPHNIGLFRFVRAERHLCRLEVGLTHIHAHQIVFRYA